MAVVKLGDEKVYSQTDKALIELAANLASLDERVEQMSVAQQTLAEEIAEHSRKSMQAQAMMLAEVERLKSGQLLSTGDQRAAVEQLKLERRAIDVELRAKVEAAEREHQRDDDERREILKKLDEIQRGQVKSEIRIGQGVTAYQILKWAGIVIGGILLATLVARVFLMQPELAKQVVGPVGTSASGEPAMGLHDAPIVGAFASLIGSAWIAVSGLIAATIHVAEFVKSKI